MTGLSRLCYALMVLLACLILFDKPDSHLAMVADLLKMAISGYLAIMLNVPEPPRR